MSNVWTPIALRVSCAAPRQTTPFRPFLQLLNTYSTRSYQHTLGAHGTWIQTRKGAFITRETSRTLPPNLLQQPFSTSQNVWAKRKSKPKKQTPTESPTTSSDSKIEPAPTKATHREGVPLVSDVEQLTWRDYDPAGGMPLPNGELSQTEIKTIFEGDEIDADTGNYIASVMHWRRMSGALIDVGLDFPHDSGVDHNQALKGLEYVRTVIPDIDEEANGQVWVQEESLRLQEQIQQRAIKLGIYKAQPEDIEEETEEEEQQGTSYGREKTGTSVLQTTREAKEAKNEQERAEKRVAQERAEIAALHSARGPLELGAGVQPEARHLQLVYGADGVMIQRPQTKAWLDPVDRRPWVKYYEDQATIIKDNAVPQLSTLQRLGPSFLVLLLVLSACYYLHENYTPPPKSARLWPDTPPSVTTLCALTGVLLAAFAFGRVPPLWRSYSKYMTVVPAYPYALGLLGASLRHDTVVHLASNLASLWLFGLLLHEDVGRGTFLAIYFASGALGGFTSLTYNVLRQNWMAYIFGSSGCVLGVVAAACTLRPNGTIKAFGYDIPIAAWVFLALFAGAEAVAVVRGIKTSIDHSGHLGGMLGGLATGLYLRRRAKLEDASRKVHLRTSTGTIEGEVKAS